MSVAISLRDRAGTVVAVAVVDVEDAHLAVKPWYRLRNGYAVRTEIHHGKKSMLYLHREVMRLGPYNVDPSVCDHRDGNRLNCRRENLRVGSHALNAQNRSEARRKSSLPRGVRLRRSGTYEAYGKINGKVAYLGCFPDMRDAAAAALAFRLREMEWNEDDRRAPIKVLDENDT